MGKRMISIISAMAMMISMFTALPIQAGAETYGDLTYTVTDNKVTITDCQFNATTVDIPAQIDGMVVTAIGDGAFAVCSSLTNVTIPASVTSIGDYAFRGCSSLTSIVIPDNTTYIGKYAFSGCRSLTSISIPYSVTFIGQYAFLGCDSLMNITVSPNNNCYMSVDNVLFDKSMTTLIYCLSTKEGIYNIPDSVTYIENSAFRGCNNLINITIPDSVTSIGDRAFESCSSLTSVKIPKSMTSIGNEVFRECSKLTNATIPNGVTSIGHYAFMECISLKGISIPNSVTSIGGGAFWSCKSLMNITIPDSVTYIGGQAFLGCSSLTSITIPNGVESVGYCTFSSCSSLTSIILPNSVTLIDNSAFSYCSSLTSITIPNGVTSIGSYAFSYCSSLTSITIPNNVTSISFDAFSYCSSLTSIIIPDSVRTIGYRTFEGCTSLSDVYYSGTKEQWNAINIDERNTCLTNANIHYNNPIFTNSNSTSAGAPIITSATLSYTGTNYDIFNQDVTIEKDSDIVVSIEASVNANGNEGVRLYITQGVDKNIDITGITKDITPGKDFSAEKPIYILAVDTVTGKSTSKATKLKVSSIASGSVGAAGGAEGLNFKLGSDTGFTIPNSVPVFGGTEIAWSFDYIPISVEYDQDSNNKLNVVFGTNIAKKKGDDDREYFTDFNFAEYKKSLKSAASKQNRTLKQLRNDFKMTDDIKMNMFGGNLIGGGSGAKGSSVDVAGYAEMYYTQNGWQFAEGQLCLDVEFTYNYQGQIFIWVVPLYYEFGGGAGVGFEGDMRDVDPISFSPEFEAYLTGKIKGLIGGGVGIAKVATAGAAGEAQLNLKKSLQNSYFKADVDGSANFNVKVFGKVVAEKEFARGNFLIYETGNANGLINGGGVSLSSADDDLYDIDVNKVYENESREYAQNPTKWLGDNQEVTLMSADYTNKDLHLIAENIYTEAKPQLCDINGTKVLVMQWDNTKRADADRAMLVYSIYDETSGTWSSPAAVDDDGTADFYPCFNDGWLVWQNEKITLTDDMTLTDIAKVGEIYAAKWNGNGFDTPIAITDNDTLDTQPCTAKNQNGNISVAWTTNSENDILGVSGTNAIMQADIDNNGNITVKPIISELNAVTTLSAGNIDDNFCVAYVCDDDNDLNTIDDRDIRIINNGVEAQLTDNNILDSNPIFINNMIYYYSDGNIIYSNIDGSESGIVFGESKAGLTDNFVADVSENGDIAIWWTKVDGSGVEVYTSLRRNREWSDEIKVTSIGNRAKYPCGLLNNDGSMLIAFNNAIEQENEIARTDLYMVAVEPSYDLELTDAYFDEAAMTAYATVKNSGELPVRGYNVHLDEMEIANDTVLKAGESAEIEIEYDVPADLSLRNITMSVDITDDEEYNVDNNSVEFEIGHADIEVGNAAISEDMTVLTADISNIGYSDAASVRVKLRDGSADGTVIDEQSIDLAAGAAQTVRFVIDTSSMRFTESSKQLYVTTEGDFEEVQLGNNDTYTLLSSPSGVADYETAVLDYSAIDGNTVINSVAVNNTASDLECTMYTAVYDSTGLLKGVGMVNAAIGASDDTGVDITVSCDVETNDIIKTFMWKDQESLCEAAEITVN